MPNTNSASTPDTQAAVVRPAKRTVRRNRLKPISEITTGDAAPLPPVASLLGMHGRLRVSTATGKPVLSPESLPEPYQDIVRVDWAEYRQWLGTQPPGLTLELVMEDFGIHSNSCIGFEPACTDSREMTLELAQAKHEEAPE